VFSPFLFEENTMFNVYTMSDADLLGALIGGKTAARLLRIAGGSLAVALNQTEAKYEVQPRVSLRLQVAKELIRRALLEPLRKRDALSSPTMVRDFLRITLAERDYEVFMVLFLDSQNHVIECEEMFRGTLSQTSVYPREIVKRALFHNAAALILAHNHPSGVAEPSRADEMLTATLTRALALVDVKVLDHFVIGSGAVLSFAERGML
jgi:DNA repair protein RadC